MTKHSRINTNFYIYSKLPWKVSSRKQKSVPDIDFQTLCQDVTQDTVSLISDVTIWLFRRINNEVTNLGRKKQNEILSVSHTGRSEVGILVKVLFNILNFMNKRHHILDWSFSFEHSSKKERFSLRVLFFKCFYLIFDCDWPILMIHFLLESFPGAFRFS